MRQYVPLLSAIIGTAGFDISHKLAGSRINNFLGPVIVGGTEIFLSLIYLCCFFKFYSQSGILITPLGICAAIGVGVSAWMIDIGLLELYFQGQELSRVAPLVIVISMALSAIFGILILQEPATWKKLAGIATAAIACYLLSSS